MNNQETVCNKIEVQEAARGMVEGSALGRGAESWGGRQGARAGTAPTDNEKQSCGVSCRQEERRVERQGSVCGDALGPTSPRLPTHPVSTQQEGAAHLAPVCRVL